VRRIMVELEGDKWLAQLDGTEVARGDSQDAVVEAAYDYARVNATDLEPISVQLREKDGTYGLERTYPRKADPTTSPG
jgi:hypothetical protein